MKPLYTAGLVALAALVASLTTYYWAKPGVPVAATVVAAAPAATDNHADEVAKLREDLATARARVQELEAAATTPATVPPEPAAEPKPAPAPSAKKPSLDEIREAIRKNGGASAQIQALTELKIGRAHV